MTSDSVVSIGLLLPDVLSTYSDSGNATVLAQRLRWRGIGCRIVRCTADVPAPTSCEIYLLGGGEDTAQLFAARWLREHRGLCRALSGDAVTLAVCAGMQILGRWMLDTAGNRHPGADILDLSTIPRPRRAIGDLVTECVLDEVGTLCGFENHRGATTLGPNTAPLGRVLSGVGNDDVETVHGRGEGVRSGRIIGTYLHGPVLARNPNLADHLLAQALGRSLPELELPDQGASRERYLRHTRQGKLGRRAQR